eukprot:scaffold37124_cov23-Tisochrysis_lutea.AAC.1
MTFFFRLSYADSIVPTSELTRSLKASSAAWKPVSSPGLSEKSLLSAAPPDALRALFLRWCIATLLAASETPPPPMLLASAVVTLKPSRPATLPISDSTESNMDATEPFSCSRLFSKKLAVSSTHRSRKWRNELEKCDNLFDGDLDRVVHPFYGRSESLNGVEDGLVAQVAHLCDEVIYSRRNVPHHAAYGASEVLDVRFQGAQEVADVMEKGADATHRPRRRTPAEVQRSPLQDEMVLRLGQGPIHLGHLIESLVRGLIRKEGHLGPVVLGNRCFAEAVRGRQTAVAVERMGHWVSHDAAFLARRRQHARHWCQFHMEVGGHQLVRQLNDGHGSRPVDGDAHW